MTNPDIEALAVEQVDREAAKSLLGRDDAGPSWWSIDSGNADSDPLVQAFARHRLTALRSTTAEPVEVARLNDRELIQRVANAIEMTRVTVERDIPGFIVNECVVSPHALAEAAIRAMPPTDSAAKDAEIAAYREVLVKVRDWCCPVLCINCADNRKAIDIALANRGEAGSLAKERAE